MSYLNIQYGEDRVPRTSYPAKLVKMLLDDYKVKKGNMLEIGCGRGDFALAWKAEGMRVYGADKEDASIGLERFFVTDVTDDRIPMPNNSFDLVFHKSLLEHIPEPSHLMFESYRLLVKGGKCIIMCPDWRTYMKTFYDDFTHVRPYDKVSLKDLMEYHGFKDVTVKVIHQYPAAWHWSTVYTLMTWFRWVCPVELGLWLSEKTGIQFFKWACQLTLVGVGTRGEHE